MALLLLVVASPAAAQETDKKFERMLKAVDTVPMKAQLDEAWPDAEVRLMRAAADPARDTWTRARAMSLLSLYPSDATRAFLEGMMRASDVPRLRQVATYTLGRAFGAPGDAELVAAIVQMTRDPDEKVRRRAVRALRWIDLDAARVALEALAKDTTDAELSKLARYVLERREARLGPGK